MQSLAWLDLSDNHLVRIEGGSFSALPRLRWLDLSNNLPFNNGDRSSSLFKGLERRLSHLGLKNVSLSSVRKHCYLHNIAIRNDISSTGRTINVLPLCPNVPTLTQNVPIFIAFGHIFLQFVPTTPQ